MPEIAPELKNALDQFRIDFESLRNEIGKVIVGQQPIVDGVLLALVAGGHVLLEGVPGLGKTMLVRTLASALDAKFTRIQFTPDLMPADLVGTTIMVEGEGGSRNFRFERGPIFANVLLADANHWLAIGVAYQIGLPLAQSRQILRARALFVPEWCKPIALFAAY